MADAKKTLLDQRFLWQIFGTLMSSGVPILQTTMIVRDSFPAWRKEIQAMHDEIKEGENMFPSVEDAGLAYHPIMAPLIQIGEESGELPEIMAKGADLIKRDCDFRVDYLDRINSPTLAKQRFFDYTATLVEAGYPLMRTLSKLENFPAFQGGLANAIGATIGSFATGSTFAEALARHPEYFDKFDVNMVKAGEVGGVLDQTLIRAAHYYSEKYSAEAKKGLIGRVVDAFRGN